MMFAMWRFLAHQLTIVNLLFHKPSDLTAAVFPQYTLFQSQYTRFCSKSLQTNVQINLDYILGNDSHFLFDLLNRELNFELQTVQKWKSSSISLSHFQEINHFLNQRSIVIDDMVFLISLSDFEDREKVSTNLQATENSKNMSIEEEGKGSQKSFLYIEGSQDHI